MFPAVSPLSVSCSGGAVEEFGLNIITVLRDVDAVGPAGTCRWRPGSISQQVSESLLVVAEM